MRLQVEDEIYEKPTEKFITAALALLEVKQTCILLTEDSAFIQTRRDSDHSYALEYLELEPYELFEQNETPVALRTVTESFLSFFHEDHKWKSIGRWRSAINQPDPNEPEIPPGVTAQELLRILVPSSHDADPASRRSTAEILQSLAEDRDALKNNPMLDKVPFGYGPANPSLICPHCQIKGHVRTRMKNQKMGISGGKATAALITAGLSLFVAGLSRKEKVTQAFCGKCSSEWHL
jgi:hypothetical protein